MHLLGGYKFKSTLKRVEYKNVLMVFEVLLCLCKCFLLIEKHRNRRRANNILDEAAFICFSLFT
jgi:hypothetical protein